MKIKILRKLTADEKSYKKSFKEGLSHAIMEEGTISAPNLTPYLTLKLQKIIMDNLVKEYGKMVTRENIKCFLDSIDTMESVVVDGAYIFGEALMKTALVSLDDIFVTVSKRIPEYMIEKFFVNLHTENKGE